MLQELLCELLIKKAYEHTQHERRKMVYYRDVGTQPLSIIFFFSAELTLCVSVVCAVTVAMGSKNGRAGRQPRLLA